MRKEKFTEILRECGFNNENIKSLWNSRPSDDLDEEKLRESAECALFIGGIFKDIRDQL